MTAVQFQILQTLAYFDIFHYPLSNEEIKKFLSSTVSQQSIDEQLSLLTAEKRIYEIDEFYSLRNELFLAARRRAGNRKAVSEIVNAAKAARILSKFPFVEGLALSGSLSKNYADDKTDIDFFIITKTNRLWIARTLMHIFYKFAVIARKQHWFCMNYYVDKAGMEIAEKNIFTAVEIITLIPVQGNKSVADFKQTNQWANNYFPAYTTESDNTTEIKKAWLRLLGEKIFSGGFGNAVDNWLMRLTAKRWRKKESKHYVNAKGICMGMLAGKHFAKPDPRNFQYKILQQLDDKVDKILEDQNQFYAMAK